MGSVNDRVWVDGGELGLWTGTGTRALTLTPTTPRGTASPAQSSMTIVGVGFGLFTVA